jgi:hypothetical protein
MATITVAAGPRYPHDALPDGAYAPVGERLADAAPEDAGTARTRKGGVCLLNRARPFVELAADGRSLR